MTPSGLRSFVRESNAIEGIHRAPTVGEIGAHERLLARPSIDVIDLEGFVYAVAAGAELRKRKGMDVHIGGHRPPPGGPGIENRLRALLVLVNEGTYGAHEAHVAYELLHPFMDGNGRSGRALWAWMMTRAGAEPFVLSFLQRFYYQTLDAARL